MQMLTWVSARLAVITGLLLIANQVAPNWGDWQAMMAMPIDLAAAWLLVTAGITVWSTGAFQGRTLLAGSWGFACALCYFRAVQHIDTVQGLSLTAAGMPTETLITIGFFLATIIGYATSLFMPLPPPKEERAVISIRM